MELIDSSVYDYRQNLSQKENIKNIISDINHFCFDQCVKLYDFDSESTERYTLSEDETKCIRSCSKQKIDFKDLQLKMYKDIFTEP